MSTPHARIATLAGTFRASLLANLEAAAMAGWTDGGGAPGKFPSTELANIQTVQLGRERDFMIFIRESRAALRKGEDVLSDVMARLGLWVRSVRATYTRFLSLARGKTRAAMVKWNLGPTDHCNTCKRLAAEPPHRMEWFTSQGFVPQQPGASMDCGGWRCQCFFTAKAGGARVSI